MKLKTNKMEVTTRVPPCTPSESRESIVLFSFTKMWFPASSLIEAPIKKFIFSLQSGTYEKTGIATSSLSWKHAASSAKEKGASGCPPPFRVPYTIIFNEDEDEGKSTVNMSFHLNSVASSSSAPSSSSSSSSSSASSPNHRKIFSQLRRRGNSTNFTGGDNDDTDDDDNNNDVQDNMSYELRSSLHLAIGRICRDADSIDKKMHNDNNNNDDDDEDDEGGNSTTTTTTTTRRRRKPTFSTSNGAIVALTDLTYHFATSLLARDLVAFSEHARRQTIKTDDVLLVARKDKCGMLAELKRIISENPTAYSEGGGGGKKVMMKKKKAINKSAENGATKKTAVPFAAASKKGSTNKTITKRKQSRCGAKNAGNGAQKDNLAPTLDLSSSSSSSSSSSVGSSIADSALAKRRRALDLERETLRKNLHGNNDGRYSGHNDSDEWKRPQQHHYKKKTTSNFNSFDDEEEGSDAGNDREYEFDCQSLKKNDDGNNNDLVGKRSGKEEVEREDTISDKDDEHSSEEFDLFDQQTRRRKRPVHGNHNGDMDVVVGGGGTIGGDLIDSDDDDNNDKQSRCRRKGNRTTTTRDASKLSSLPVIGHREDDEREEYQDNDSNSVIDLAGDD